MATPNFLLNQATINSLRRLVNLDRSTPDAHYNDETDGLFNAGLKIQLYHIPSRTEVAFKAFITDFSDQFQQSWNEEEVYGRNDPHQVFKGTKRVINIGWVILATDISEAKENMRKVSLMAQMQYPTYNAAIQGQNNVGVLNANAIQASPVFRLKFLNWIQDANSGNSPTATAKDSGLVGKMDGFNFEPNLDTGVFHDEDGSIYPKEISVSISYTALHTHELGWKKRTPRQANFPYGEDLSVKSSHGRTPVEPQKTRNSSGATLEQKEAKQLQMEQALARLHDLGANWGK